jgi:hypothetical protein
VRGDINKLLSSRLFERVTSVDTVNVVRVSFIGHACVTLIVVSIDLFLCLFPPHVTKSTIFACYICFSIKSNPTPARYNASHKNISRMRLPSVCMDDMNGYVHACVTLIVVSIDLFLFLFPPHVTKSTIFACYMHPIKTLVG